MPRKEKKLPKNATIKLVAIGSYKREQKFELQHALKLLRLPNTQWELNDERYLFENNDIKRNSGDTTNSPTEK